MRTNILLVLGVIFIVLGVVAVSFAPPSMIRYGIACFVALWAVGSAFIGIAMWSVNRTMQKKYAAATQADIASLKSRGRKIMTDFKALDRRWEFQLNQQPPSVVYTQDQDGRTYESENIWFQGRDATQYNNPAFQAWQKLQAIDTAKKIPHSGIRKRGGSQEILYGPRRPGDTITESPAVTILSIYPLSQRDRSRIRYR